MPLAPNPGHCPPECEILDEDGNVIGHRRVRVVCFGGYDTKTKEPAGWPAGGRGGCNWRIGKRPHPYEIREWEII